jgi:hypothetical protein
LDSGRIKVKKIRLWKNRSELSDQYAIVDDEDYEKVCEAIKYKSGKEGKWYVHTPAGTEPYAVSGCRYKSIHRVVMNNPAKGMDVDHINGDTLNNRKENLRVCTRSQNAQNKEVRADSSTGMKGVYKIKKPARKKYVSKKTGEVRYHESMSEKRFRAYIGNPEKPNRKIHLGAFLTKEEAAIAYDKKAIELFGEFAVLNFPEKLNEYLNLIKQDMVNV